MEHVSFRPASDGNYGSSTTWRPPSVRGVASKVVSPLVGTYLRLRRMTRTTTPRVKSDHPAIPDEFVVEGTEHAHPPPSM
jgi:hypothetical protein